MKLVNDDVTHYLIKSLKDVNLLVSNVINFFFSKVIKKSCSTIESLFSIKGWLFSVTGCLISEIEIPILIFLVSGISSFKKVVITIKKILKTWVLKT